MTIMTVMMNNDDEDDDMEQKSMLTGDLNKMIETHGA